MKEIIKELANFLIPRKASLTVVGELAVSELVTFGLVLNAVLENPFPVRAAFAAAAAVSGSFSIMRRLIENAPLEDTHFENTPLENEEVQKLVQRIRNIHDN